jgi:two-component system chemotaxis response regulator CheB
MTPAPAGARLRVLVVDDSRVQRGLLLALLEGDPELEAAGWAASGAEAVRAAAQLRPDVITMDLRMPGLDGLEATRLILQQQPVPIVLVTASAARDDRAVVREAFDAGVLAIVAKPDFGPDGRPAAAELLRTVKSMARVKVVQRRNTGQLAPPPQRPAPRPPLRPGLLPVRRPQVVAVGASTGGPQAFQAILPRLPADFALPVLVVQHIAPGFAPGVVEWLAPQCALPVRLAAEGLPLDRPGIYVAPGERHLAVHGRALTLTREPPVSGHRPSATVLFRSVAAAYGPAAIGVLLTGMGDDGAVGLAELKRAGGITVAQDEATSVVFGMPAAAIGLGAVDHVAPLGGIAPLLLRLCGAARGGDS